MIKIRTLITLSVLTFHINAASSQIVELEGKVYDSIDSINQPLSGALISSAGGKFASFSDEEGRFKIRFDGSDSTVRVSHSGFEDTVLNITNNRKFLHVRLERLLPAIRPLIPGDTVPEYLWDLPLEVVNHPDGKAVITLRDYKDAPLLVLDIWAGWCKPCVESVIKYEALLDNYPEQLRLVTIHNEVSNRALPFIQKKGWKSPAVVGFNRKVLIRSFFLFGNSVGKVIYIHKGKILSISGGVKDPNFNLIHRFLEEIGRTPYFYTASQGTYLDDLDLYDRMVEKFDKK